MSAPHEAQAVMLDVLASQSELNSRVGKALEALALTADRYDAELAEIRDELATLGRRLEALGYLMRPGSTARRRGS